MKANLSCVADIDTASTNVESAWQRARNLSQYGVKKVLELCVGPSLQTLEKAYAAHNIQVIGNDIEYRWKSFYPKGKWIIGDALTLPYHTFDFDAVVFAPPLSHGCTGKREDALSIDDVNPHYLDFLQVAGQYKFICNLVLPGRSLATRQDREQFHKLINKMHLLLPNRQLDVHPLSAGRRDIVKYYDVILK